MAVLSSLIVLSWSCTTWGNDTFNSRSSSNLIFFSRTLIYYSSEASVDLLVSLASSEETMNEEGFTYKRTREYSYYEEYTDLTVEVVRVADNCWEVSGTNETMNFSLLAVREASDTVEGNDKWTVSSLSLDYGESNGYTAVMTTEGDIVYDWHVSSSSWTGRVSLLQTGTYYLQTYRSDVEADSCVISYDAGVRTDKAYMAS